jgi:quinol monooxygenase YgiN
MSLPLNVVAIMKATPGKEAQLHTLLQAALPHFQQEPGCQAYALLVDLEDPTRFVTYERWDDEAALQAHMKAPTLTNAMPVLEKILAEPMQQIRLNQLPGSTV